MRCGAQSAFASERLQDEGVFCFPACHLGNGGEPGQGGADLDHQGRVGGGRTKFRELQRAMNDSVGLLPRLISYFPCRMLSNFSPLEGICSTEVSPEPEAFLPLLPFNLESTSHCCHAAPAPVSLNNPELMALKAPFPEMSPRVTHNVPRRPT